MLEASVYALVTVRTIITFFFNGKNQVKVVLKVSF